jgi:transcriptional regulator with XRE-family HTH domain
MYTRIRNLREDADLRQKDLAAYLNCSQVCYSRYELGERDIPTAVLAELPGFTEPARTICWGLPT